MSVSVSLSIFQFWPEEIGNFLRLGTLVLEPRQDIQLPTNRNPYSHRVPSQRLRGPDGSLD
jgi:hypothetical protein